MTNVQQVPIVCEVVPSPEQDELQIFMHADR